MIEILPTEAFQWGCTERVTALGSHHLRFSWSQLSAPKSTLYSGHPFLARSLVLHWSHLLVIWIDHNVDEDRQVPPVKGHGMDCVAK